MPKAVEMDREIEGQTFGYWTVIGPMKQRGKRRFRPCRCRCGTEREVNCDNLIRGLTRSCGCLGRVAIAERNRERRIYPEGFPREFSIWRAMINRCKNTSLENYRNYGGRGITVCKRWLEFAGFLEDMGNCPQGMSIERIDNDGPYCPENCRWATRGEQNRNKRSNMFLTYQGETLIASEWADRYEIRRTTFYARLYRGLSIEEAINYKNQP